jgi:VWFA-related protein
MGSSCHFVPIALAFMLIAGTSLSQVIPESVPRIGASTDVVIVDVTVTDKRGQPVTNLAREDFLVFEDGRPADVIAFRGPAPSAPAPVAFAAPTPRPEPTASTGEPLTVVLYLENAALTPGGRRRILEAVRSFVGRRLPSGGFRVLLLSDVPGANVSTAVTRSVEEVEAALEAIARTTAGGATAASEERQTIETVREIVEMCESTPMCGGCMAVLDQVVGVARAYADSRQHWLAGLVNKLSAVVGGIGALPGRKALVYASEALEQRPGVQVFAQIGDICPQALEKDASKIYGPMEEYDISRALRELAARANAGRVTLYPVDARGLQGLSAADPSFGVRRYTPSARNDAIREANLRAPLEILAQETGGIAIVGRNDPASALGRLPDDLAARYDLGISPGREPDGRTHSIKVRLRRGKGLTLRYRKSYLHAPRRTREDDRVLAALLYGMDEDTLGAIVTAELAPADTTRPDRRSALVHISVPLARLASETDGDGRGARLRLLLAVRKTSGAGESLALREKDVAFRLPAREADGPQPERHEIVVDVALGEGEHEIAVGVHDALSSLASYRRLRVD